MTDFPIDPHGNDWSFKAMADRLDNIGSLSDEDAATLDRIALELRAASVVATVAAAVAQPVTPPPVPEVFRVGPLTMGEVFKPAGLTNLSNLQAVLDAVEKALARV